MKREIKFYPAYDKRNDPKGNFGVHGVDMRWILQGELGVIQFVVYTNWHLKHVQNEFDVSRSIEFPHLLCHPMPAEVGYHSPKPMYEGQPKMEKCDYLPNGCYYDGLGLYAEELFNLLVERGDEPVWKKLEETYVERFGELK